MLTAVSLSHDRPENFIIIRPFPNNKMLHWHIFWQVNDLISKSKKICSITTGPETKRSYRDILVLSPFSVAERW